MFHIPFNTNTLIILLKQVSQFTPASLSSDSDSDSELSVDEHSSSYASSHSSDSEDDDIEVKPKWNNERPLHSTPKGVMFDHFYQNY